MIVLVIEWCTIARMAGTRGCKVQLAGCSRTAVHPSSFDYELYRAVNPNDIFNDDNNNIHSTLTSYSFLFVSVIVCPSTTL